ncbi:MAG: pyridoxamine 5'-phosphate oxidase family protein [Rhodospirillales bacterium]|nr:MAG: pyridoxamine 5'-phosphate oxidase family protein [Rhodospirillales bacterium]
MFKSDPFHAGEREIQERTGERGEALLNGRLISNRIPAGARSFLSQQQYCILGWAVTQNDIWAAFIAGQPGFAECDEAGLSVSLHLDEGHAAIPPYGAMRLGDPFGMLFIDLSSRRRLRVNGSLAELSKDRLRMDVAEAFPNCPKFIQRREARPRAPSAERGVIEQGHCINDELKAWISGADTFFVASAYPNGPVDVSHRGGALGFVQLDDGCLRIPDYPGNSMFGTLGNFAVNPRAGLMFLDFQTGRQLQMTGDVRLDLDAGESSGETGGTGRWWEFTPRRWIVSPLNKGLEWKLIESSPFNP